MNFIHERISAGDPLLGTWCNLGSSITVEMAGIAGFDWVLIDLEHGVGDYAAVVHQVQAASATGTAPIVRIPSNDTMMYKRILDLGASGIMVPYVETAEDAQKAVQSMRYPPDGYRGAAATTRATAFGAEFAEYFSRANNELVTILQIETAAGIQHLDEIAAVDGVDVLFVGPFDLSTTLGIQGQYSNSIFLESVQSVIETAKSRGLASGILAADIPMAADMMKRGMSFVAFGSDGGLVATGMRRNMKELLG